MSDIRSLRGKVGICFWTRNSFATFASIVFTVSPSRIMRRAIFFSIVLLSYDDRAIFIESTTASRFSSVRARNGPLSVQLIIFDGLYYCLSVIKPNLSASNSYKTIFFELHIISIYRIKQIKTKLVKAYKNKTEKCIVINNSLRQTSWTLQTNVWCALWLIN